MGSLQNKQKRRFRKKMIKEKVMEILKEKLEGFENKEMMLIVGKKFMEASIQKYKGKSYELYCAGLVYLICRKLQLPKSMEDIAVLFDIWEKEIGREYKRIKKTVGMQTCREATIMGSGCVVLQKSSSFAREYCKKLNLSEQATKDAEEMAKKYDEDNCGRSPKSIGAGAVYLGALMNGEKKTQREVADIAGVTEVTIRNSYTELMETNDSIENRLKLEDLEKR